MGRAPVAGSHGVLRGYILDPTVQFVGGCLLTPPAFAALEAGGPEKAVGYFTDPFLLGALLLTAAAAWVTQRSPDRCESPHPTQATPPSPAPPPSTLSHPRGIPGIPSIPGLILHSLQSLADPWLTWET